MKDRPARITSADWEALWPSVPEDYRQACRFLEPLAPGGVPYLFTPHEYSCRGDTLLRRLRFDSGLASLRLWAFLFSEKDRLFLAREKGWNIFAAMKDLGQVPVLTYAAPKSLTFYADELWWAPCFAEEPHLLDAAAEAGATEELCFVRAALGAYRTLDYFPRPDLSFAGVGACCDDFSAVMQLIEAEGHPIHWWEIPARLEPSAETPARPFGRTPHGQSPYPLAAVDFLAGQFRSVIRALERHTGRPLSEQDLRASVRRFNRLRGRVRELRERVYAARRPPLPGLEMLLAEFVAIHACSEPWEAPRVLDDLLALVRDRQEKGLSPFENDPVRVFWVTPPTDAAIVTLLEDLGGCVAGSEYLISHAFLPLDEKGDPVRAVAENYMDDPLIGASAFRARRVVEQARRFGAEGVLITGIFGASHCPYEERVIARAVQEELDLPVLAFDVPYAPGRLSEQVANRVQGFVELLRSRRGASAAAGPAPHGKPDPEDPGDPFAYFRDVMALEADFVREEKRKGRGVAGIYCEFTPREVILAAGALPVCLCGASARTVAPAETVLPANLCPLVKSSFGYVLTSRCPFYVLSDMVVAETTCDGKKKMFELLAERKPTHVLELTQKPDEERAFDHWLGEIRALEHALASFYGVEITAEKLREASRALEEERELLRRALSLGMRDPPVVTGRELASLRFRVAGNPATRRMLRRFVEAVEERAARGHRAAPPDARRVMLTGCPTAQGTGKIIDVIESSGGVVVVQEACSGWKPVDEPVSLEGDPREALARKYFRLPCSCMTPNRGRLDLVARLARDFRAEAVVDLVWQACHTYNVESYSLERFVREELGLPFLKVETDYSASDREQLAVRVATLLEMAGC